MVLNKKVLAGLFIFFVAFLMYEFYLPESFAKKPLVEYVLQKGMGYQDIAKDLAKQNIIKNALSFEVYSLISLNYSKLQAGKYELSPSMSIAKIVEKLATGDIVKNKVTVIEGWTNKDLAQWLADKNIYSKAEFNNALKVDYSYDFDFLKNPPPARAGGAGAGKPKNSGLEGYIFPDTYYLTENALPEDFIRVSLSNFDKKLTPELKQEIFTQKKSIFQIVTMASMLEKEVKSLEDKKIVSGILWKRIKEGIPLQVDATVNYATGKSDIKVAVADTKVDSRYNTYKYYGLPLGPISNPGMDSILTAIYPEKTDYWYYLSADGTGKTIFSRTLEEHNEAIAKYFK